MTYRFYVTYPYSSVETEVFPLNFNSTSLIDEVETGRIFRRRKFNGTLMFGTNSWAENEHGVKINRKVDFDYFYDIEITEPCESIYLEITRDGDTYWLGKFSTSDGEFDLDKCTFSVTPQVQDKYTAFDEEGDSQVNILQGALDFYTTTMSRMMSGGVVVDFVYTRNVLLIDAIEYLARQIDGAITIESDFFTEAINPVTLTTNRYNLLTLAQKSDIKRWSASDKAWKGFISFNELMEIIKIMNLYWVYDDTTNTLTIEHISHFSYADGLDLRTQKLHQSVNRYKYDKNNMPASEKYSFMEANSADFIPHSINYFSPCTNQDKQSNTIQYSWNVTTDIEYIQDCMDSADKKGNISDDGWVLLANYDSGGYKIYMNHNTGSEIRFNADLGWALLHKAFFKHDRPVLAGYMNNINEAFYSTKKTRIQESSAIICDDFDASELITTELGETYFGGIKATVLRAELSPSGLVKMVLGYGQADNPIIPIVYANLIQIEEKADATPPNKTDYYAQTSVPADADITIDFDIRILDDFGFFHDDHGQITILSGTSSGSETVIWSAPAEPLASNVCRFNIYNVVIAGGALTWEYYFNLDTAADCT